MALLTVSNAYLAFGHVPLLDGAELSIERGERVALIGRNGTGKSSLLKVLAGESALDDGVVRLAQGARVVWVAQEPQMVAEQCVADVVAEGLGDVAVLFSEYRALTRQMAGADADHEALLARLHAVQEALEHRHVWSARSRIDAVMARFGLSPDARIGELSGGQRKRVALARAAVAEPDLLILDEPTNHLDLEVIRWLEDLLCESRQTLLFVTHDRRFLDRVATRILELDRGCLRSYPGNFTAYQARKADELSAESLENARFDKLLAQEEVWIRKGIEARRTRNEGRVRRLEQLRVEREARRDVMGRARLSLASGEKSGKVVAELEGVSKGFGGAPVIRDFSCRTLRGDRIGLIGPNGAGKTTLLKLMLGLLPPDSGEIRLGTRLNVAYFDQFRAQLPEDAPLVEVVSPGSDYIEIEGERKHVMSYLGDFLFSPARARSPVSSLSGGERNRLLLARLFAKPANVLVLDEPTNDLDIDTLELLEARLQDYGGTLFLVSHDRAFLDNIVTQVIASEGNGYWKEYVGGYEDWLRQRPQPVVAPEKELAKQDASLPRPRSKGARPAKLGYKEQRELEALPGRIETLEVEQAALAERLNDPAVHVGGGEEGRRLSERVSVIEEELLLLLERWEALEARAAEAR